MKTTIKILLLSCVLTTFIPSCKKDKTEVVNPDIEYHHLNTTLKSFYPQPTPSDRFEIIGNIAFDSIPFYLNIDISWETDPDGLVIYGNDGDGKLLNNSNGLTKALDAGVTIDSTLSGWSTYSSPISYDYIDNPSADKGEFAGKGDKYLAFYNWNYSTPGKKYYGWAKVNVSADGRTLKLIEYASQKLPNTAIKTGEK